MLPHELLLSCHDTLATGHHPQLLYLPLQQPMILLHGYRLLLQNALSLPLLLCLVLRKLGHQFVLRFLSSALKELLRLHRLLFEHLLFL